MPGQIVPLNKSELEKLHLFTGVDFESVMGLLEECPVSELEEDDVLLHKGEANHFLYVILSGHLRIHLELSLDPITILGSGEVVGELSLIDGQPTSAYAIATDHCRLLALNEKTVWSLVEASHAVARNLLFVLSRRLRHGDSVILTTQQLERDYSSYAVIDALTGLYNSRWLDNMLGRQMERCKRAEWSLALLIMDVDDFEKYNDTYGQLAGDRALHTLASTLRESMRPGEMIARCRGDKFVAVLPELDAATARSLGERVRRAIAEMKIYSLDKDLLPPVSVTIGVAQMRDQDTPETLMAAAGEALSSPPGEQLDTPIQ